MDNLNIDIKDKSTLNVALNGGEALNVEMNSGEDYTIALTTPTGLGTRNYALLANKPQINGITLAGNITTADLSIVSENTTAGWAAMPLYIPKAGEVCVYTDGSSYVKDGETVYTPEIKVGDGSVPVVDLPFVGEGFRNTLAATLDSHINDSGIHVSAGDRLRWNSKLNYTAQGDELIFTRE